jgi:hypothetical protein
MIKKFSLSNPLAPSFPQAMAAPSTFMFQLPGELEKESKAKKGITKLMLLHICADIDYKGSSNSNILFAIPSNGMEVVLNQLVNHALINQLLLLT